MKKFFVLIAAAIVSMTAMAQIQFGAKIGVDATHFWGKDTEHGMKIGYQFGALMEYKFNSNFAIAPEVVFASQGGKFKIYEVGNKKVDNTFTTNYINVPVMFKWYATPKNSLHHDGFGAEKRRKMSSRQIIQSKLIQNINTC